MRGSPVLGRGRLCLVLVTSVASACYLVGCSLDRGALVKSSSSSHAGVGASSGAGSGGGASGVGAGTDGLAAGGGGAGSAAGTSAGNGDVDASVGVDACGGCDDGVFCNGMEHCLPGDPAADARGCVSTPVCLTNQVCDEATSTCTTDCNMNGGDADGDGFYAVDCGGDDCNDASPLAYPGGLEVCDGLDNDCTGGVDDGFAQFSCLSSNTLGTCSLGQCVITACSNGYADCDKLVTNGCEVLLDATPGDCQTMDCLGASMPNDGDVPQDDGNDCTVESCSGGVPRTDDATDGTNCNNDKGTCQSGACQ